MQKNFARLRSARCLDHGFSLIELLIVVVIIAILVAIAMPQYNDYVRRSKIVDATSALSGLRTKAEQYFADKRTFEGMDNDTFFGAWAKSASYTAQACAPVVAGGYCKDGWLAFLPADKLTAATYTITVTGQAGTTVDGFTYSVDQANTRSSTTIWGNNPTCWVRGKGGAC